jgi:hypothetical protein
MSALIRPSVSSRSATPVAAAGRDDNLGVAVTDAAAADAFPATPRTDNPNTHRAIASDPSLRRLFANTVVVTALIMATAPPQLSGCPADLWGPAGLMSARESC